MRTTTQVSEFTFGVKRYILVSRDRRDDFGLVMFAQSFEIGDRVVARHDLARHRNIAPGELGHPFLNRRQVVGGKWTLVGKIVVEAVFDNRADRNLRVGKQLLDRIRQQMGGRMANQVQAVCVFVGDDCEPGIGFDHVTGIDQSAINFSSQCRFGETCSNACRYLGDGNRLIELSDRLVRKRNGNHGKLQIQKRKSADNRAFVGICNEQRQ